MRAKKRALREQKALIAIYPHYPFQDLDIPEVHTEARAYMQMRRDELPPNDGSYVVRSRNMPDRRLAFPDQRLWQRLRSHSEQMHTEQEVGSLIKIAPQVAGQLAVEQAVYPPEL